MKEKITIIGSEGYLGSYLKPYLKNIGYDITSISKSNKKADFTIDVSFFKKTYETLDSINPEIIINLSGLRSVEECELNPNLAYVGNVKTVESLTNWIKGKNCFFIHISTDHVYDKKGPHSEKNVNLINYYAMSKYCGEIVASSVPSTILRTNFIGRSNNKSKDSMTDWLFQSIKKKIKVQILNDVYFSPLHLSTLSSAINQVIKIKKKGIYNLGSKKGISKADFDIKFAKNLNLSTNLLESISIDRAKFFKANRPKDMRLDSSKFERAFNFNLPELDAEITKSSNEYK
jgi:dTDP-4-dehydrorhamnose reductase